MLVGQADRLGSVHGLGDDLESPGSQQGFDTLEEYDMIIRYEHTEATRRAPRAVARPPSAFLGFHRGALKRRCRGGPVKAAGLAGEPPPRSFVPMTAIRKEPHGFTLIEMLVVIIVLGLLAALVGPRILGRVSEAKSATARTQIELLGLALDNYRLDNGSYPTTEQGLAALQEKPMREPLPLNWRGPYLKKAIPLDPWGRPYIYKSPGEHNPTSYDLSTLGRDGQPGGEDEDADITSWK